jgi:hypothetical protein
VVVGGPFGGGSDAFGFGSNGLSICFTLNCGFGGGGFASTLPGPPSAGQLASESTFWNIAAGIGKELSNTVGSFLEGYYPSFLVQSFLPTQKASNSAQTWAMRGTFAATLFIPGAGEEEALAVGESKLAGRMTDLYLRFSKTGAYQKVGVSVNAATRYSKAALGSDRLRIVTRVAREQALAFERFIYKRAPGPLNNERGAGSLFSEEGVRAVERLLDRIWK